MTSNQQKKWMSVAVLVVSTTTWFFYSNLSNPNGERDIAAFGLKKNRAPKKEKGFIEELHEMPNVIGAHALKTFKKWVEKDPIQMWDEMRESNEPVLEAIGVPYAKKMNIPWKKY